MRCPGSSLCSSRNLTVGFPLGEGISSVSVCFFPLPCLGYPTRGSGLMLGALCVRIQSLYSVLVMKDCDKLIYEFRRELIITFAKKSNLYIKLLYVHFKVFILLSLSLQIISLYNGWLFNDSLASYFLIYDTVFLKGYYLRNGYIFVGATELL